VVLKRIVPAHVARSNHHYDAGIPGLFNSLAEGIQRIALVGRAPDGKVDDLDVVSIFQVDRSLNGVDHRAVAAAAGIVEHAQVHDIYVWRNALKLHRGLCSARTRSASTDDPRHVGAMSESIGCR